jgi:hypothetical protein
METLRRRPEEGKAARQFQHPEDSLRLAPGSIAHHVTALRTHPPLAVLLHNRTTLLPCCLYTRKMYLWMNDKMLILPKYKTVFTISGNHSHQLGITSRDPYWGLCIAFQLIQEQFLFVFHLILVQIIDQKTGLYKLSYLPNIRLKAFESHSKTAGDKHLQWTPCTKEERS